MCDKTKRITRKMEENIIKQAKKEVFDDIEKNIYAHEFKLSFTKECFKDFMSRYNKLKKKHLGGK